MWPTGAGLHWCGCPPGMARRCVAHGRGVALGGRPGPVVAPRPSLRSVTHRRTEYIRCMWAIPASRAFRSAISVLSLAL